MTCAISIHVDSRPIDGVPIIRLWETAGKEEHLDLFLTDSAVALLAI